MPRILIFGEIIFMGIPNWITLSRILLVPFFVALTLKYKQTHLDYIRYYAIGVFFVAVITDAVDGAVARIRKQKTVLGALLDPLADKILLLSAVIMLSLPISGIRQLPIWIPVTVISRDLILFIGALVIYVHNGSVKIKPNIWGKFTTAAQMMTVLWMFFALPEPQYLWRVAGSLTILSGMIYVYQGSKQLNDLDKKTQVFAG